MAGRRADPNHKKAALYIRVSTRWQVDGDSLPMQREELPKYCKYALDIDDYEIFEDAGYSGKNMDRPAYQTMMSRVRGGEFSHIVVWKLDRISRNLLDFASMYTELKRIGVVFISKNEQFDTSTAIGEAMLKIILIFAELERNMTSERVTATMISRASTGQWNGGPVPFGYSYDKETKTFSIIEAEAATVRLIYQQYERQKSLLSVCKWLNESGRLNRGEKEWNTVTLCRVLKSPFYIGAYRYNYRGEKTTKWEKKAESEWIVLQDHHQAIIDADRQRAIIQTLESNDRVTNIKNGRRTYNRKNVHIFAGIITCAICGAQYDATIDKARSDGWKPSVYLCSTRKKKVGCNNKYVSDASIGPIVLAFIGNYIKASRSIGKSTDAQALEKKLMRGDLLEGIRIEPASLDALLTSMLVAKFGADVLPARKQRQNSAQFGLESPEAITEKEIVAREIGRLERAIQRLKTLYLYSDDAISEQEYLTEQADLLDQISKQKARLAELEAAEAESGVLDDDFMQEASFMLMADELTAARNVDYAKLIRVSDREMLKEFVQSVLQKVCINQGRIEQLTLGNGISVKFLYQSEE